MVVFDPVFQSQHRRTLFGGVIASKQCPSFCSRSNGGWYAMCLWLKNPMSLSNMLQLMLHCYEILWSDNFHCSHNSIYTRLKTVYLGLLGVP